MQDKQSNIILKSFSFSIGTPRLAKAKRLRDGQSMENVEEPTESTQTEIPADYNNPSSLQEAPTPMENCDVDEHVNEPTECSQFELLADCNNGSSPTPRPTPMDLILDIQNLIMQSMQLAGDEISLLQHVQRSSVQMLTSLQAYKACLLSIPPHPTEGLTCLEDGFGMSLVRAKPFIESFVHKKRSKRTTMHKQAIETMGVQPFPLVPRRKKVTLQGGLDKQAHGEDSD